MADPNTLQIGPMRRGDLALLGAFMSAAGRLPGFSQGRLDDLIDKKKTTDLTDREEQELNAALAYIEEKSIELMAFAAQMADAAAHTNSESLAGGHLAPESTRKPQLDSPNPPPVWARYIDSRLKQFCTR